MIENSETRHTLCDIARYAFEIVGNMLDDDQVHADRLRTSVSTSRQIYREETITETLLVALRKRFPQHVEIAVYTQPEESKIGADWYWRVERGGQALHARVQAKRVHRPAFN